MFVRNAWYIAAWGDEIGDTPLARRICNEPIVLFRDRGKIHALEDRCPHRGIALSIGELRAGLLTCAYHGVRLDLGARPDADLQGAAATLADTAPATLALRG